MKTVRALGLAVVLLVTMAAASHAYLIDYRVDFKDGTNDPGGNWNLVDGAGTTTLKEFATGATGGVQLGLTHGSVGFISVASGAWNAANAGPAWLDANKYAADDCLRQNWNGNFTITISGLTGVLADNLFTVELVSSNIENETEVTTCTIGTTAYAFKPDVDGYDNGTWMTWTDVAPAAGQIVLTGVAGGGTNNNINAFRISTEEPVAEPAGPGLVGLALLGLRKKRS